MVFPPIHSRDQDHHQRRWLALGFGGKTADETTWRYWSEAGGQGPWRIAAPHRMAEYQLVDKKLYLDGELVLTGRTQWDATWRALAHFYAEVVPALEPPPLSPKGG